MDHHGLRHVRIDIPQGPSGSNGEAITPRTLEEEGYEASLPQLMSTPPMEPPHHQSVDPVSTSIDRRAALAYNYVPPPIIQHTLDGYVKEATAVGILATLFAATLGTLAQTGLSTYPQNSKLFIVYLICIAMVCNLLNVVLSLVIVLLCAKVHSNAVQLILGDLESWPYRIAAGELPPVGLLQNTNLLLSKMGMPPSCERTRDAQFFLIQSGVSLSFIALLFWASDMNTGFRRSISYFILLSFFAVGLCIIRLLTKFVLVELGLLSSYNAHFLSPWLSNLLLRLWPPRYISCIGYRPSRLQVAIGMIVLAVVYLAFLVDTALLIHKE